MFDLPPLARRVPNARRLALTWLYGAVCRSYAAHFYPDRVTLLVPEEGLDPASNLVGGWREMVAELDAHFLPGNHASMITEHASFLAEQLRAGLNRRE